MKKSHYFSELFRCYNDEVDDLVTDSAGKSVLQKRLNDKRREMDAILPMIEFSPEMVAVVFYDAFSFNSPGLMKQIVLTEPDDSDFIAWEDLKPDLVIAEWAEPLIAAALKVNGGEVFLVATALLEFMRTGNWSDAAERAPVEKKDTDDDRDGDDEGADDLGEAGAEWLSEQGFESLDH